MSGANKIRNVIYKQLQQLRAKKKLTQSELAAKCQLLGWDVSRATLSKVEYGYRQVNDAEILILQKALNVDLKALFPEESHDLKLIKDCVRNSIYSDTE